MGSIANASTAPINIFRIEPPFTELNYITPCPNYRCEIKRRQASPEEAAATLQRVLRFEVGPIVQLENLGDEAYSWRFGMIRFRKGNFVIDVVATKSAIAEKLSAYAVEAVPEK